MKLAIKVHGNVELSKSIQSVLFQYGFTWPGGMNLRDYKTHWIIADKNKCIWHDSGITTFEKDHDYYLDAATEFGKLIEHLTKSQSTTFSDGDKEATVFKDGSVKYGCTTVKAETVDKIFAEREKLRKANQ